MSVKGTVGTLNINMVSGVDGLQPGVRLFGRLSSGYQTSHQMLEFDDDQVVPAKTVRKPMNSLVTSRVHSCVRKFLV